MRIWLPISMILIVIGIALIIGSVLTEEGEVGLLLIFPFIVAHGWMGAVGGLMIFFSIICMFVNFWTSPSRPEETVPTGPLRPSEETQDRKRVGGVVLIGPIPIAFGSDERMTRTMLMIGIAVLALFVAIFLIITLTRVSP